MDKNEKIEYLISNREALVDFLYTPWRDVVEEMERRELDTELHTYLKNVLPEGTPSQILEGKNMALARHVATPNYEMHRFIQCADVIPGLRPMILEYTTDKYVNINATKHALAELKFHVGRTRDDRALLEKKPIINRNESNGLPLNTVTTKTNIPLVDFHHQLFEAAFPHMKDNLCDLSEMYCQLGGKAHKYYKAHLSLFLKHNVLFENFLINKEELGFLKNIILPTMLEILEETGYKPLIVNLGPTGNEEDVFWISYPPNQKENVNKLLNPPE
jgi:hypothetical protein